MSKKWMVGTLIVMVLALSAVAVARADDDVVPPVEIGDEGRVWMFSDNRLNAYDMGAPVAIYYTTETVTDADGEDQVVVNGIKFLAIDSATNAGKLVLEADLDTLLQLVNGEMDMIEANGYGLHYSSGIFWMAAPPDAEGKIYSFSWENADVSAG